MLLLSFTLRHRGQVFPRLFQLNMSRDETSEQYNETEKNAQFVFPSLPYIQYTNHQGNLKGEKLLMNLPTHQTDSD